MQRISGIVLLAVITLAFNSEVQAQRHHVPSIAGHYRTPNNQMCQIAQDGDVIVYSSRIPGQTDFMHWGKFGMAQLPTEDGRKITRDGFHGSFIIRYDDGRPDARGTASLFPNSRTGEIEVRYFRKEGSELKPFAMARLIPVKEAKSTEPAKLSDSRDEFGILPLDELKSLGF